MFLFCSEILFLQLMSKLYLESGLLSWNGNGVCGSDRVQKFYIDLPPSDHVISALDAQPIIGTPQ